MPYNPSIDYRIGTKVAFAVGLPVGLAIILVLGPTNVSREPMGSLLEIFLFARPVIPLIAAFVFALWIAGDKIVPSLVDDEAGVLLTSFLYSMIVILITCLTYFFVVTTPYRDLYEHGNEESPDPSAKWFVLTFALATLVASFPICWITKRKIS